MKYAGRLKQRGVALVTAMLLMVIGVLLAAKLSWDSQLHLRRATTAMDMQQARLFAMGAETIAIEAIRRLDTEPNFDLATDDYFTPLTIPVGIEETDLGTMTGQLSDLQGRLNLNSLIVNDGTGSTVNAVVQEQLISLLDNLRLDVGLADAIIDWIDLDTLPQQRGAEDGVYTSLDPPYRPANREFTHISELLAVQGIGPDEYKLLQQYVTVLPGPPACAGAEATPINLNFASAELMAALDPDISRSQADAWFDIIQRDGLTDMTQLGIDAASQPGAQVLIDNSYVGMVTHCFGLTVYVTIGSSVLSMYSVLERMPASDDIFVRQRIFGIENPD